MTTDKVSPKGATPGKPPKPTALERRKAALKANMAKRKAQARARAGSDGESPDTEEQE